MAGSLAEDIAFLNLILTPLETGELKPAVLIDPSFNQFEKHVQHSIIESWKEALNAYQELLYSGQTDNLIFEQVKIVQE